MSPPTVNQYGNVDFGQFKAELSLTEDEEDNDQGNKLPLPLAHPALDEDVESIEKVHRVGPGMAFSTSSDSDGEILSNVMINYGLCKVSTWAVKLRLSMVSTTYTLDPN